MSETKYFCDLCKEERDKEDLYTYYYDGCVYNLVPFGTTNWREAHKHLCKQCLRRIKESTVK